MADKPRLLRITTVPISLKLLLRGQLNFFQSQGFDVLAISADGPEIKDITASGIRHKTVNMTRKITPLRDFIALVSLIRIIRSFKPQIVHTHTPKAGLLGMVAAWWCNIPVRMHTVAGLPLMESIGIKRMVLELTEKITYRCATTVYPNSSGLKKFIEAFLKTPTPLKIIGSGSSNGINVSDFKRTPGLEAQARQIRERYQVASDEIVFSFVGRIVKDKGIRELVKAFREMITDKKGRAVKKSRLLLIGHFEQDLDPIPPEDIAFLESNEQVILAGFQSDVRPWIMASDIFVFPSYREGFPNVVMQACCLEVPCIVSDINGCNEIISHDVNGLIVPAKNASELCNAMVALASNDPKREKLASHARDFVVKNFDQRFVWEQLLLEYNRQLGIIKM